ncbi:unnamed protein product, partial [Mesorhabditis spiculigera]
MSSITPFLAPTDGTVRPMTQKQFVCSIGPRDHQNPMLKIPLCKSCLRTTTSLGKETNCIFKVMICEACQVVNIAQRFPGNGSTTQQPTH